MKFQFVEQFTVRDYECDSQGIVNNAVYLNYLEHARHVFMLTKGVDVPALAKQGLDLVVIRAELDYKKSLVSNDKFYVGINFSMKDRVRFQFHQSIFRSHDDALMVEAVVLGTGVNERGRPKVPREIVEKLMS
ncbi:acyl-CoA thioesterase [Reinekea sp.]|jgi:acyl-CoA thioester hydrolase|uniref:acyl-CoA thioesterase n=1 Tax=Reinekea sp. TaxID=1970455 RepID=UPI003988C7C5